MTKILKQIAITTTALIFMVGAFNFAIPAAKAASFDLRDAHFIRNGRGDIELSIGKNYSEQWISFKDKDTGKNITRKALNGGVKVTANVGRKGTVLGSKLTSARAIENVINSKKRAGDHFTIHYKAIDNRGKQLFRERDVRFTSGGGGGGSYQYDWDEGPWGSCRNNRQTRDVFCENQYDVRVSDRFCDGIPKPSSTRTCNSNDNVRISTLNENNVTDDSARLRGKVDEGNNVNVWFAIDDSFAVSCSDSDDTKFVSGRYDEGDIFSKTVFGLDEDTTYYYRACAYDDGVVVSGFRESFRTTDNGGFGDVDIRTLPEDDVDEDSAELRGKVEDGDNVLVWFALDNSSSVSCSDSSDEVDVSGRYDAGDIFSKTVFGLDEDEIYYYRACAEEDDGSIVSGFLESFRTDDNGGGSNVEVRTLSERDVDEDSAELRGEVREGDNVEVWFAIDDSTSVSCSDSSDKEPVSGRYDDGDTFRERVTGLREDRTYYYRACAEDEDGDTVSGSRKSFRTDDNSRNSDDVEVRTLAESSVDENSAQLRGKVREGDNVDVWFALDDSTTVSCSDSRDEIPVSGRYDDGDTFSKTVTRLREGRTYYYRACAEDEDGDTVSGSRESFRTDRNGGNDELEARTLRPTFISRNYAQLNGTFKSEGEGTTVYFEWGRTSNLGNRTTLQYKPEGIDSGNIVHGFTNLSSDTNYCYRAIAIDNSGTDRGSIECFKTLRNIVPPRPSGDIDIATLEANDVHSEGATLRGEVEDGNNISTWFVFGTSTSQSCTSGNKVFSGSHDEGDTFIKSVDNLERNTTYYYRACGENSRNRTSSGELRNFNTGERNFGFGYGLSFIRLNIENNQESVFKGDDLRYDIEWENISDEDLQDLTLHIEIPQEIRITDSSRGRFNEEENSITVSIGDLDAQESGSMEVFGTVTRGAEPNEAIVAKATIAFENPINYAQENAVDYDNDFYGRKPNFQAASVITLGSVTFWGWVISLLLLILIILVARWLYLEGRSRAQAEALDKVKENGEDDSNVDQPQSNYIPYRPQRP